MNDLISRQAAIDALERIFDRCEEIEAHMPKGDPDRVGYKMYPDWLTVWKYLHQVPSAEPEQRWIPVTERLPDEDYCLRLGRHFSVDVLMTVCNSNDDEWICELGHTINGEWYSEVYDEYIEEPRKVIAWMPTPEPYKGDPT